MIQDVQKFREASLLLDPTVQHAEEKLQKCNGYIADGMLL